MPAPTEVNPKNFTGAKIIFDNGEFAVAWGIWVHNGEHRLAMRWNGDNEGDRGYPQTRGYPMWFLIHPQLTITTLRALLQEKGADNHTILKVLAEEI